MPVNRLYVKSALSQGKQLSLNEEQSHYISNVMRSKVHTNIRLFNGEDGEWIAEITHLDRRQISVEVMEQLRVQPATKTHIEIWFAPIKKTRTELIVEKATELGVSVIQPIITERSQFDKVKLDRFQKIAIEAAEQTERLDLPSIRNAVKLFVAIESLIGRKKLYYCDEISASPIESRKTKFYVTTPLERALSTGNSGPSIILVGPEGGFSERERQLLRKCQNTIPVSLGPRILRAETAVIAALSLWQAKLGDWKGNVES